MGSRSFVCLPGSQEVLRHPTQSSWLPSLLSMWGVLTVCDTVFPVPPVPNLSTTENIQLYQIPDLRISICKLEVTEVMVAHIYVPLLSASYFPPAAPCIASVGSVPDCVCFAPGFPLHPAAPLLLVP